MGVTINGDNIVITGATIEVVNGANSETGVAYIIITPEGGVGELPFMAQGLPGQPTLFPSITVEMVHPDNDLPTENPEKTLVDPGGAGEAAQYNLKFYVHSGADGATGSPSFAGASDLASSPVLGVATDKFVLVYKASDSTFVPTAQKVGTVAVSGIIAATAYNSTNPRLLHTISIAAQPFDYIPIVWAGTVVTGSGGGTPTRVDLFARLDDPASGDQLGHAKGMSGANADGIQTIMLPTFLYNQDVPATYGRVAMGDAANVYLRAEQQAASSSSWSTPASPGTTFSLLLQPLL